MTVCVGSCAPGVSVPSDRVGSGKVVDQSDGVCVCVSAVARRICLMQVVQQCHDCASAAARRVCRDSGAFLHKRHLQSPRDSDTVCAQPGAFVFLEMWQGSGSMSSWNVVDDHTGPVEQEDNPQTAVVATKVIISRAGVAHSYSRLLLFTNCSLNVH